MPLPTYSAGMAPDQLPIESGSGIWTIDGDSLVNLERFDLGPAIVLVPSEEILLLSVDLPIASARRRLEALPFAIEERIAQPIADIHAALGAELGAQRYLAGVMARERMQRLTELLIASGLGQATVVPDVLGLPLPPPGAWSLDVAGDRALVRAEDGTGFALPRAHLVAAWAASARPRVILYGGAAPEEMAAEAGTYEDAGLAARLTQPALDLRQGRFAAPRRRIAPLWRRVAIVAAAGICAHAAIAGVDTIAVQRIATNRATEMRALVQQVAPSAVIGDDVAASAAEILPASGAGPSGFLPLFVRVGGALKPLGSAIHMHAISYDASAGTMSIEVEAATMEGLQQVGSALTAAGLSAQAGAASQSDGKAAGAFLIRGAA
ncbi:general secretion pathway protein GspL [Sphingomonas sp. AP4-R1]|uniref:type II secretion system protein GspL n=1 Tax=Sphingomonas sp. AP4-R1 TaxID=2735134 RepID=UPI001493D856|nr:type II secretion system protein GspL [Sphingomonas sp. AP4-R1]QJU57670.1 general secretion pathway protein GspL [Sphingomonas sp. AP4-R1]